MSAKTNDKLYLAAGGVLLAGTCVWAFLQQSSISAFNQPVNPPLSGSVYEPGEITLATLETKQWGKPEPQAAGPDWLFEVFTPPIIYYNIQSKQFTVEQPVYVPPEPPPPPPPPPEIKYGLELVKVVQPLFRLQLVGYVGEGPNARGNFENQLTGDIIFGTTGKKIPDLNLEVVSFVAERRRTKDPQGGTEIVETICNAVVRDTVTGVETKLDHAIRTPEGPLAVTFKNQLDGTELTAKAGDTVTVGEHTFTIGELQLTPPSAVVTKQGGELPEPETKTLLVPPPAPPPPPPSENGEMPPDLFSPAAPAPAPGGFSF